MTISETSPFNSNSNAIPAPPAKGSIYVPPKCPLFSINNFINGESLLFPPGYRSGE